MRHGQTYLDAIEREMDFLGITIPLQDGTLSFTVQDLLEVGTAVHVKTGETVRLYDYYGLQIEGGSGLTFTDTKEPLVLVQEDEDGEELALIPVNEFFDTRLYKVKGEKNDNF